MKPLPLRARILAALELAPMTYSALARMLSVEQRTVEMHIEQFRGIGVVRHCGSEHRPNGRPLSIYGLRA